MRTEKEPIKETILPLDEGDVPDAVTRPEAQELSFIDRSRTSIKQTLKEATDWKVLRRTPYGMRPIILIALMGTLQAFDSQAFGVLRPEIIRDLDIRVETFLNLINFVSGLLIFLVIPVAYYSDRYARLPVVGAFSVVSGIFSFLTGRAGSITGIGVGRVGDIIGKAVTGTPLISLLPDYYPPEQRGKAFAAFGTLVRAATLFAPLFVLLTFESTKNWRLPFYILGPALVVIGVLTILALREPVRGYFERKSQGANEEVARVSDEPPSLGEAWRTIWAIRTLRRFFIANIFDSAGSQVFALFFILYLFERYGLTVWERVALLTVAGAFTLMGGYIGGGVVDSLIRRRPQRVITFLGLLSVAAALALGLVVSGPPLWILYIVFSIFGFASALIGPAAGVIYAQISPPNVRSLAGAVQGLSNIPGILISGAVINVLLERWGFQGALSAAVPFIFLGALVQISAAGFFERDMRAAFASAIASEEWRRAKESGKSKLLVCRDVDVEYNGVQVLFGVDFDVEEGEIVALLGTNGAGKSTLLRAISGTQEASSGAIVFDGRDITHMPPHEITARAVTHMPGGRGVFPTLTVKENLLLGGWVADEAESRTRLTQVFELFPILKERQNERAGALSGGEQQMVSLAQAFLGKPRLLMIDELSLGLSPAVVQQLVEVVRRIHATGVTIIIVEQSVNVALTIAEKAIFMEKGEVKFIGKTSELLSRPDILRAVYVKGAGALREGAPASAMKSERELRRYEIERARSILEVRGITKSFGGIKAVNNVSFELREGEALGLIGPNGAGKTTIFEMISGYQMPDAGQVFFEGADVTMMRPDEKARLKLIRRFQDARLFPALTVYENLLCALDQKLEVKNFAMTALQVPQARQSERRIRVRAERLVELLELGAFRDKFVKELSTGLRRIVDLACVLATEPKVLMLDEPSSGIAQAEAEGLGPLLRRVRFETGCSLLVIEHDIPLISAISDELIAFQQGEIVLRGAPDEVLNDERVIESYLGTREEVVRRSGVMR